jgi:hypothetical protein
VLIFASPKSLLLASSMRHPSPTEQWTEVRSCGGWSALGEAGV